MWNRIQQQINVEKTTTWSKREIHTAAQLSANDLGYFQLKPEEEQAISAFVDGQDVFVSLATGYGKTFASLPFLGPSIDWKGKRRKSINVVVSPLKFEHIKLCNNTFKAGM